MEEKFGEISLKSNLETHSFKIHTCSFVFVPVRAFLDNIVRVCLCFFSTVRSPLPRTLKLSDIFEI